MYNFENKYPVVLEFGTESKTLIKMHLFRLAEEEEDLVLLTFSLLTSWSLGSLVVVQRTQQIREPPMCLLRRNHVDPHQFREATFSFQEVDDHISGLTFSAPSLPSLLSHLELWTAPGGALTTNKVLPD